LKRKLICILIIFAVFIGLVGCSDHEELGNTYNWETDYQYPYHRQGLSTAVANSGSGYYFLYGKNMYYTDKTNMKPVLLDNRPDADYNGQQKTDSKTNTAYSNGGFLTFYNGKLYTLEIDETVFGENNSIKETTRLIEMSKDGTDRKTILTLDFPPAAIAIHRGIVYYTVRDYSKETDLEYYLMKYNLKKKFNNKPEVVYTGSLPQGWIQDVIPYGDNVYFLDVGKNLTRQMRYDIKNKTVTRIINDDDNLAPHITGFFNNKLLFNIYDGDDNYEKKWKVYSSDLDGSKIKELPIDINFISNIYSFGDYIFVRPVWSHLHAYEKYSHIPDEMVVYDSNYKKVDKVDMSNYTESPVLVSGDDKYMFISYGKNGKHYIDYLDKKEIGSGKLKFKNLFKD
jgi:hypothetical protein